MATSKLSIDIVDSSALFAELNSFLAEFRDCPFEVRDVFLSRCETFFETGIFNLNQLPATRTGDVVFELEFTQSFREFMVAARAGELDAI